MSFNTKTGYSLVKIIGKGNMNNKIIRIDDKDKVKDKFNNLVLPDNYEFMPIPNIDAERTTLLVVGMAGSGKSYFVGQWLKQYRKMFDYPIYIFSEKVEDKQLDEIKNTQRIKLSLELAELDYTEFKECCCVYKTVNDAA
jgi:polynucleotide 5'-kinase involved in rRNA processing